MLAQFEKFAVIALYNTKLIILSALKSNLNLIADEIQAENVKIANI